MIPSEAREYEKFFQELSWGVAVSLERTEHRVSVLTSGLASFSISVFRSHATFENRPGHRG